MGTIIWYLMWNLLIKLHIFANLDLFKIVIQSLSTGFLGTLFYSGTGLIFHLILRLILYKRRYIPWNYTNFLNYATDLLFLQRVGGGYRFIHDLLREHFAQGLTVNQCLYTLTEHSDLVRAVAISSDGQTLASCSFDDTIKIWNLHNGKLLNTLTASSQQGCTSIAVSYSSQLLVSSSNHKTESVKLWHLETGELVCKLDGHSDCVWRVKISPDGQIIAGGCGDGKIALWNLETREIICLLSGHSTPVTSIAFSADGQLLASGSEDTTIKIWNLTTKELIYTLPKHPVRRFLYQLSPHFNRWGITNSGRVCAVTFSPDNQTLISGSASNAIQLWNPRTGKLISNLSSSSDWVQSVAISFNGEILAGGTRNGLIELWNLRTGEHLGNLIGHTDTVNSLAFSPDGTRLVSGSDDNTVRIWDVSE